MKGKQKEAAVRKEVITLTLWYPDAPNRRSFDAGQVAGTLECFLRHSLSDNVYNMADYKLEIIRKRFSR